MTNIINLSQIREQVSDIKRVVLKVDFKKRGNTKFNDELYLEESHYKNNELTLKIKNNSSEADTLTLTEDPYRGGYALETGKKSLFLDFSEALDLYVLLNSLFNKVDGIDNIVSLLEE